MTLADYLKRDLVAGSTITFGPITRADSDRYHCPVARRLQHRGFVVETIGGDPKSLHWDCVYAFLKLAKLRIRVDHIATMIDFQSFVSRNQVGEV